MHVPANNQAITMCITWQACCRMYGHSKYPVVDAASSCSKQIQARLGLLWPPLGSLYMNDTRALADDCASELGTATVGSSWLEVSWMINSRHCSNEAYTPLGCSDQVPNLLGKLGFLDFCRSSHESASTASRWGSAALCQAPVKQRSLLSSQLLVCRWVFKAVVVPMWVNPTLWCPAPHADAVPKIAVLLHYLFGWVGWIGWNCICWLLDLKYQLCGNLRQYPIRTTTGRNRPRPHLNEYERLVAQQGQKVSTRASAFVHK